MKRRRVTPTGHREQSEYYTGYWLGYADAWEQATAEGVPPAIRPIRPPHLRLAASDGRRLMPPCRDALARPPTRTRLGMSWRWVAGIVVALALAVMIGASVTLRGDGRSDPRGIDPPAAARPPSPAPGPARSHTISQRTDRAGPVMTPAREPRPTRTQSPRSSSPPASITTPPTPPPSTPPSTSPGGLLPDLPILGDAA